MPLNRPALDLLRASANVGRDLQQEIEQFLFYEGSLLDDHQLEEWLGLLAPPEAPVSRNGSLRK